MSCRMIRLAVILLLACSMLAGSAGTSRAWGEPTLVSNVTLLNTVRTLRTDGRYVAWVMYHSQGSPGSTSIGFGGVDRTTGEPITVDISGGVDTHGSPWAPWVIDADIDSGVLALSTTWNHYYGGGPHGVFAKNLLTGQQWQLSTVELPGPVAVSGSIVYWVERVPGYHGQSRDVIWMQDITDPDATPTVFYTATNAAIQVTDLSVAGDRVIWQMRDDATTHWWLIEQTLDGHGLTIAEGEQSIPHDLSGDVLVYREADGLTVRYLMSGVKRHLAIDAQQFATDGRYIIWNAGTTIQAYDLQTDASFTAAVPEKGDGADETFGLVAASNGALAWTRHLPVEWPVPFETVTGEIHAAQIALHLPSSPQPDPGTTDPGWTYYPETGHYLAGSFRDYWAANGGLPVFGYPMTEEYQELSSDTGLEYTVQFTERQRFEWHPVNAPPYHVLLGRLGAELLSRQGRDWTIFPTADPSAPHYMPETRHAINARFWDYWSTHGLDFGDTGVSFRESLALFGYPLSEPMVETNSDGDTVLTQYFERAVFEYHSDNPAEWQVLLRRLGAELLAERGWTP